MLLNYKIVSIEINTLILFGCYGKQVVFDILKKFLLTFFMYAGKKG